MNDDDVMPNDGSYFFASEPADQALERKKEKALALEGMDFLKEMLGRLQTRIDFYEANSSIPEDVRTDPRAFLVIHNTYSMMAATLRSEREYLEDIIKSYKR